MKKQPSALLPFLKLVKQTKELCRRTTRQILASREMAGAAPPQHARPDREATGGAGQKPGNVLPPDRGINAEKAAAEAGAGPDDQQAEGGPTEQPPSGPSQLIPPNQAPADEQTEKAGPPELSGAGRDFKNRFDTAQGGVRSQAQSAGELEGLLDQALTLLESLSRHPALHDYAANQRKLEEIEQRLNQSGNVF
jgi:hypothetical protein